MKTRHKWMQYKHMRQFRKLKSHLPETEVLDRYTFKHLIGKYGDVILKPDDGRRGTGVYRVSVIDKETYQIHKEDRKKAIGKGRAYDYLKDKIGSRKYLVQRRIPLATIKSRPMDVRVIVQRKRYSDSWKMTAIAVKVAGKGYIVTNIERSNGTILTFKKALRKSSLKGYSSHRLLSQIERVAIRSAEKVSRLYSHHRIFGFDMGLDKKGYAWIIEVNRFPMMSHFRKLKDRTMYRRILKYKKS
jgi:glutathione synthase/RimK-type ligase-like ATP-grasp enzyme